MAEQNLVEIDGFEVKFSGMTKFGVKVTWKNKYTAEEAGPAISKILASGEAEKVLSVKAIKVYRYA